MLDRKQSTVPPQNEMFKKKKKKTGEEKENIGPHTVWKSWTAKKRVVDDDDAIDRGRKLTLSAGTTEEAAQCMSPITSLL